ncbi:2-C-methyl-D-erythritol 4-phosphate cytidylyltransferase [Desulfitibacter alkalitolerans]|uniref:2-C-methyl-D-erythritol 4-phosphate cytidylyltransferase n=1 Tax=Desulfitibacter alkalitolerans TaxID=264641 RepID=UPI00048346C1|nr:2-C-methyl-D-erythritol 4-phosphate cytidylyltransferase [Desulfitibacter alkalitolerans]
MPYVTSIVVAAGSGKRMGAETKKQYLLLDNKPLFIHTLEVMEKQGKITGIILVVPPTDLHLCKELIKEYSIKKVLYVVSGGDTRGASVYSGLQAVPEDSEFVVVHDGARPFLSQKVLEKVLEAAILEGAAIAAVPVKDTIKQINPGGLVQKTLDRSSLWTVQTPQAFRKDLLLECYKKAIEDNLQGTDDASLLEAYGYPVTVVMGDYRNMKITTKEDLVFAEYHLKQGGLD